MALEMKDACMKCETALVVGDEAYICSYGCTFCGPCTVDMGNTCPNCGDELVRRPKRKTT